MPYTISTMYTTLPTDKLFLVSSQDTATNSALNSTIPKIKRKSNIQKIRCDQLVEKFGDFISKTPEDIPSWGEGVEKSLIAEATGLQVRRSVSHLEQFLTKSRGGRGKDTVIRDQSFSTPTYQCARAQEATALSSQTQTHKAIPTAATQRFYPIHTSKSHAQSSSPTQKMTLARAYNEANTQKFFESRKANIQILRYIQFHRPISIPFHTMAAYL